MSGQPHVVLEMVEVVTNQLGDDLILFGHLPLHLYHLRLRRSELLLQGFNPTKLFSLHNHRIVRVVHRVIGLRKSISGRPKPDPQFDLTVY